jgi:hypothetical protein
MLFLYHFLALLSMLYRGLRLAYHDAADTAVTPLSTPLVHIALICQVS